MRLKEKSREISFSSRWVIPGLADRILRPLCRVKTLRHLAEKPGVLCLSNDIYNYIAGELFNEDAAENLMKEIENSIMRLRDFPVSCSFVEDDVLKSKGYRKLIVENYIAFYIVDETVKQVVIMRVLYGRQKY